MNDLSQRARQITLASVLAAYPDEEAVDVLRDLELDLSTHPAAGPVLAALAAPRGADDLRSAFVDLFDRGGQRASLHETEYGRMRGMSKGNDLADIAGFYNAFGLGVDSEAAHETPDHIAIELEFYAMLLLKEAHLTERGDDEGRSIVKDARQKFLRDHLGSFAAAIVARPDVASDPVYGPVFGWVRDIVAVECRDLGVTPAPLDYFSDGEAKEEMKCGSVHLPIVS
jgi:nitrate reductase assembly molybdenum cofactor insertion protein NarJ